MLSGDYVARKNRKNTLPVRTGGVSNQTLHFLGVPSLIKRSKNGILYRVRQREVETTSLQKCHELLHTGILLENLKGAPLRRKNHRIDNMKKSIRGWEICLNDPYFIYSRLTAIRGKVQLLPEGTDRGNVGNSQTSGSKRGAGTENRIRDVVLDDIFQTLVIFWKKKGIHHLLG